MSELKKDYASPPGWLLKEYIEEAKWDNDVLANLCFCSPELIEKIIQGTEPITPDMASKFEKLGWVKAYVWLEMEDNYRKNQ